jgi:hypothetical protein
MQAVCAHKEACLVQLSEFLLRRSRRGVVRRRVLDWASRLVRRDRRDAEDIFLGGRLRDATAYQGAGRWDAGQVRLQDQNPEVRRDETVHQMVVRRDELEIFGPAKEGRRQVAMFLNLFPNLFLKPTQDFPMAQQRQDVVHQERPAGRVRQGDAELPGAAQMAQLQVLAAPLEQPSQEPHRVSQQQVPDQTDDSVDERSSQ